VRDRGLTVAQDDCADFHHPSGLVGSYVHCHAVVLLVNSNCIGHGVKQVIVGVSALPSAWQYDQRPHAASLF
jgi:hypothetical protein